MITVDGKTVFDGTTQTTLGYYTIKCQPTKGSRVKIQLASQAANKDNNQGVEVNGQKLDDGVARDDANSKGTLSILEAEIYVEK